MQPGSQTLGDADNTVQKMGVMLTAREKARKLTMVTDRGDDMLLVGGSASTLVSALDTRSGFYCDVSSL